MLRVTAVAAILAGPTALAFFSGGYFDQPRLVAGIVAWVLAAVGAVLAPHPLPRSRSGRLALGGLAALTALVGLSILWTPVRAFAQSDLQRLLLYLGALIAAVALLRGRFGLRLVEPALGAGALLVVLYALSGRLLPGLVAQSVSTSAVGRLEQPLTYWNAMGILAATGMLLATRLAGDATRDARLRAAGAGAVVPFGLAVYLTFSRGALLAVALGLILLVGLTRERAQARAAGAGVAAVVVACIVAGLLPAVRALEGSAGSRDVQGLVMLAVLLAVVAAAVLAQRRLAAMPPGAPIGAPGVLAVGLALLLAGGFFLAAAGNGSSGGQPRIGADTRRLASFESNRYDYWKVAADMFTAAPVIGQGSGAFRVDWRRERTIDDPALDAHSLYIETAGELGLLGLLALAMFLAGVAWACVSALAIDRSAAAGAIAALAALALHAGLDWDWEMPAVALIGLLLAAALIAAADPEPAGG